MSIVCLYINIVIDNYSDIEERENSLLRGIGLGNEAFAIPILLSVGNIIINFVDDCWNSFPTL